MADKKWDEEFSQGLWEYTAAENARQREKAEQNLVDLWQRCSGDDLALRDTMMQDPEVQRLVQQIFAPRVVQERALRSTGFVRPDEMVMNSAMSTVNWDDERPDKKLLVDSIDPENAE